MSDERGRVPPLFWINDAGSGIPVSVVVSGRRAICFFSLEIMAFQYAEHYLRGEPGVHWRTEGSDAPEDIYRIVEGAPQEGFTGWILNPPLDEGGDHRISSWSELRDEVEYKLNVGASWDSVLHSSSRDSYSAAEREETQDPVEQNGWQEIPSDPETVAIRRLSSSAVAILEGPSSPFQKPQWVEDFERDRRHLELSGREGAETLDEWRAQTEERIAALLGRRPWSLLHVLGLLRRLPTDAAFLDEKEEGDGPSRFDAYQAEVTERAALKYARWDGSSVELDAWEPGMPGMAQDRPIVDAERVAEIFSLARLGGLHLAYLERISRAVVRGQTVVLRPDGVSDSRPGPELRRRLELYERRRRRFSFLGETAGMFRPSQQPDGTKASGSSSAHVVRTTYREDEGGDWWRYETSRRLIRKWDKRFVFSVADLRPAYDYLKLLDEEVAAQYGLSPELIIAAISSLKMTVVHFLFPDGPEAFFPERIPYLDKRGYLIVHDAVMDGVVLGSWAAEAHRRAFPDIPLPEEPDEFAHSFKRLAYLDSYSREELRLEDGKPYVLRPGLNEPVPMPTPFVYLAGDHRIVDLNAVGNFLQGIVDCLLLEEAPRQRVSGSLERRLGDYFDREFDQPQAFEPSKKLRAHPPGERNRVVAELDASVRIGSVLVAIDAKAIQVSPGYRSYVHADLRNRWQKFECYVEHADEQAKKLAEQPTGINYDLLSDGYTHIVTLLCSGGTYDLRKIVR